MNKQNFEIKNDQSKAAPMTLKKEHSNKLQTRLELSRSNWGFGIEMLEESAARLEQAGVQGIELHGNHYGSDLSYKPKPTLETLNAYKIKVVGIYGMCLLDTDPASNRPIQRQTVVEPIRSTEVGVCHTVADTQRLITAIKHLSIQHINGDFNHMQFEEAHIPAAILEAGELLINLHPADSNRCALGEGSLDLDTNQMALDLVGYNRSGCFATPEPLDPGGIPTR